MNKLKFIPDNIEVEAPEDAKVLAVAIRNKVPIIYGCAACSCGTCAVKIEGEPALSEMDEPEKALLARMSLATDGSIRLACKARVAGDNTIDLSFQTTYSPDGDF